jgi:hypothetical protein
VQFILIRHKIFLVGEDFFVELFEIFWNVVLFQAYGLVYFFFFLFTVCLLVKCSLHTLLCNFKLVDKGIHS